MLYNYNILGSMSLHLNEGKDEQHLLPVQPSQGTKKGQDREGSCHEVGPPSPTTTFPSAGPEEGEEDEGCGPHTHPIRVGA